MRQRALAHHRGRQLHRVAHQVDLLGAAVREGDEGGGLHRLRRLVDDDDVKLADEAREAAAAAEGERGAHDVGLLQDRHPQPVLLVPRHVAALQESEAR